MNIITKTEVATTPASVVLIILSISVLFGCILAMKYHKGIILVVSICIGVLISSWYADKNPPTSGRYQYTIRVDDKTDYSYIIKNYEIVNNRYDDIWIIRDKED